MGYYTYYNLECYSSTHDDDSKMQDMPVFLSGVIETLSEINPSEFERHRLEFEKDHDGLDLDNFNFFIFGEARKWYEFGDDMIELSKRIPGIVFELTGEGDDPSDRWRYYYLNGKSCGGQAEIIYPKFSKEQLS